MKIRLLAIAALIAFASILQGCSQQASISEAVSTYTPYPKWYGHPYAYAPYDPAGTYYYQPYQYPYPYYYEGYYDQDCGDVPCSGRPKYLKPPVEAKAEPVTAPAASAAPAGEHGGKASPPPSPGQKLPQ